MRGALGCRWLVQPLVGIIPADAGSTISSDDIATTGWDHPRGCGEHKDDLGLNAIADRIIPADAGSTLDMCTHNQLP